MRVYGYLGISLPDRGDAAALAESQQDEVSRYAHGHGWRLAEMLVDMPEPATLALADRNEGGRLLRALSPGDAVITPGLDSMFPSARDAADTLATLMAGNVALHMIELGGDVCSEGMSRPVMALLRALTRSQGAIEHEASRAFDRHLAAHPPHRGGRVPFGFDVVKGRLVPKPEEYELLRQMVGLRSAGLGYRRIAREVGIEEGRVRSILRGSDRRLGALRGRPARTRRDAGDACDPRLFTIS